MSTSFNNRKVHQPMWQRLLPCFVAFIATLSASPGHAVTIPYVPLQTGSAYPPPNIMFILDDSGSMEWVSMPNDVGSHSALDDDIQDKSYVNNTIYYNPATTYQPWIKADNSRYTGGMSYTAAYSGASKLTGSTDLSDETQTYFVPKSGATDLTKESSYDRYQILEVTVGSTTTLRVEKCTKYSSKSGWSTCSYDTPTIKPAKRSEADEIANFAVWYSYHRTRMKTAKAGASEAFSQLGSNLRVGYDSIWNRNLTDTDTTVGSTPAYPIPVDTDDGLFTPAGTNRTAWFNYLHQADGSGGTPLKGALQRTGTYFESDAPWGPETGTDQISCRQNFAILTTDGYWNNNAGFTSIGDADGTATPAGSEITSKDGKTTYAYAPERPYSDNFSTSPSTQPNTLADVAMHYWKRDLRTLANDVPTSTADIAFWQHMVTFGVSIGLQGKLNPKTDLPSITNGSKHWGDPTNAEDLDRIDDLWHAAVNGRGNFVTASNTKDFAQGLVDALATVAARMGSASNVTANSTSFQSDTRVYQASYVSGKWIGELAAYEVSAAGVSKVDADGDGNPDAVWQASKKIPTSGRNILTWASSAGATFPTTSQTGSLARTTGLAPVTGADNAAYIAGATTLEKRNAGTLRDRDTVLGDIVNSSPLYLKDSETIFVGANDGMLHAFNALTGVERFAYVPRGINLADLATLSDPQYVHRYFVDGPTVVSTTKQTPGKNYLVGALGRGGRGVFGLDVTTPGSFGAGNVLWDSTGSAAPANMGQVLGDPLVVDLNNGGKGVIVSNGINSSTGTASLFILNMTDGTVIKEIDTGATGDNGLSAPRGADLDGDGTVDYVYAGDLKGNLWKFDLTGATTGTWVVANSGAPMFVAQDASGKRQPITAGVALARNPTAGKVWVFIGTGSFMTDADVSNNDIQSMYGVIDDGIVSGRSELVERQIVVTTTKDNRSVRGFEPNVAALAADKKGWYIDLDDPEAGERIVTTPRVRGAVLLTASLIPPTTNTCDAGGSGYLNAIDVFTGTSLPSPYFDSNGDGKFDENDEVTAGDDEVPIGSIDLGIGMPTRPTQIDDLLVVCGSSGKCADVKTNPQGGNARRVSWREIVKD